MDLNTHTAPTARWATPSQAGAITRDHSLESLRAHVARCAQSRGPWFSLRCGVEAVHGFLAPRFVTTLALASVVLVLSGVL